jgi:hypothetical protein
MTRKAVDDCARSRVSQSSSEVASVLFARRFPHRISGSQNSRSSSRSAGVRGPPPLQTRCSTRICQQGAGAAGVDIGTGRDAKAGETRLFGDVAKRDMAISLLYYLPTLLPTPKLAPRLWYTVNFCGKINGDGVERIDRLRAL